MNTIIPTIAHAVRHPIHRDSELSLYIERPKAERAVGFFGGVLIDLVDRAEHERVVQELRRQCDQMIDALNRLAGHGHLQESTCATTEVNADLRFAAGVLVHAKQMMKAV